MRGLFQYRDLERHIVTVGRSEDLPERMMSLVRFEPEFPPPPHTEAEHDLIATYPAALREALSRCQQ